MCRSNARRKFAFIASHRAVKYQPHCIVSGLPFGALAGIAIAVLLLSGCAVNQEEETAAYRDVLGCDPNENPPALEPNEPLSLALALSLANCHNERLAIKGEEYLQALIDKDRAAAVFLPRVNFVPSYIRQEEAHFPPGTSPFITEIVRTETTDVPLDAQIDLNIPQDIANLKRAEAAAQQQRSLLLDTKDSILLDVAKVYYQILISEAQARVLRHSILVQEQHLRNIRNEYTAGTAKLLDVSQAQSQLSAAKVQLVEAETDISNGRSTLAFLIGCTSVQGPLADQLHLDAAIPPKDQLLAIAWQNRNDLIAAQFQLESSSHLLEQAWAQYFPSVGLDFTYFLGRQSFPSDVSWIGMLQVSVPVFSAGLIHDDVRTAWSLLRQAKLYQSYLQRQIDEELSIALENINQVTRRIDELHVQVDTAGLALRQADQTYNAGLAINLDRLVAQEQLLTAQLDLADAQFTKKINYLQLLRAAGQFSVESLHDGLDPLAPH